MCRVHDHSSLSHFSVMTWPSWLRRAVGATPSSRWHRWRGGRAAIQHELPPDFTQVAHPSARRPACDLVIRERLVRCRLIIDLGACACWRCHLCRNQKRVGSARRPRACSRASAQVAPTLGRRQADSRPSARRLPGGSRRRHAHHAPPVTVPSGAVRKRDRDDAQIPRRRTHGVQMRSPTREDRRLRLFTCAARRQGAGPLYDEFTFSQAPGLAWNDDADSPAPVVLINSCGRVDPVKRYERNSTPSPPAAATF